MSRYFSKAIGVIIVVGLLLPGCNCEESNQDWDNPLAEEVYPKYLVDYLKTGFPEALESATGNQSVYVDFSDGLIQAYADTSNLLVIDYISQKLVGSSIDWFGLGKNFNGIGQMQYQNDRDLYNKVKDPASYVDLMAPIEKALVRIVEGKNDALLITDFEEYTPDGKEQKYAYAKQYFTDWISKGNSITFYYSPFKEVNAKTKLSGEKNLYFVIFNYGNSEEEDCLKRKFELAVEHRDGIHLKKLEINPHPYKITTEYGGEDKTGLSPDDPECKELELKGKAAVLLGYTNYRTSKQIPLESFEFSIGLGELYKYYFQEKKVFVKNLFLDASDSRLYALKSTVVKVTDVTSDFTHFVKCKVASREKPVLIKDEGKNTIWDKKTAGNPIILECFVENTKDLKPSYIYSAKAGFPEQELFELDEAIFKDHLKNDPKKIELKTLFHKNFNVEKQGTPEPRMLKIEIIADKVEPIYTNQLDDFKWTSIINKANGINESLYESVRNTIQDVRPEEVLYTYFLRLAESN